MHTGFTVRKQGRVNAVGQFRATIEEALAIALEYLDKAKAGESVILEDCRSGTTYSGDDIRRLKVAIDGMGPEKMQNDDLEKIFGLLKSDEDVEGWAATSDPTRDTLTDDLNNQWERKPPTGEWTPIRQLGLGPT